MMMKIWMMKVVVIVLMFPKQQLASVDLKFKRCLWSEFKYSSAIVLRDGLLVLICWSILFLILGLCDWGFWRRWKSRDVSRTVARRVSHQWIERGREGLPSGFEYGDWERKRGSWNWQVNFAKNNPLILIVAIIFRGVSAKYTFLFFFKSNISQNIETRKEKKVFQVSVIK